MCPTESAPENPADSTEDFLARCLELPASERGVAIDAACTWSPELAHQRGASEATGDRDARR